jgi:hypothetical protein
MTFDAVPRRRLGTIERVMEKSDIELGLEALRRL